MADNKVKFLRGTAAEYKASTKDNDVFYYVTDTKKLYLGANEVTGVGKTGTGENAEIFNNYESNEAYGIYSHTEGHMTHANDFSHAEGNGTQASGNTSHAEGANTVASGHQAHAEGMNTTASGYNSHAEGYMTIASNLATHAGGTGSEASKEGSFVHGQVVKASSNNYEVAFGTFNKSNTDTLFSIGNGTDETKRSNAFEITKTTGKLFDKEIATKEDIPTTLPANGGNADTLDGLHANEIASNPNLLINPDFAINQRGNSDYNSNGYAVDGWKLQINGSGNSGSYNAETHVLSGSVLDKNGYYVNVSQFVEEPMRFVGKTMTVSAGMSELDKFALVAIWRIEGATTTSVAATPYNLEPDKVLTFTMPSDLTEASKIRVVLQTRGSVKLDWAKLELGGAATPFVPPDPATELAKCQRYYQRLHGVNAIFASGFLGGATVAYTIIPIATMRTKPTLTFSGNAYIWAAGHTGANGYKATAAALDNYAGGSAIGVEFTLESESGAVGQGCTVQFRDGESYIELDAEL